MRMHRLCIVPAVALLLAAAVPVAAQGDDPGNTSSTCFLPWLSDEAAGAMTLVPVVYSDGRVAPPQAAVEVVTPYSLAATAAAAAAGAAGADVQLPPLDVESLLREDQARSDCMNAKRIGIVRGLPQAVSAAGEGAPGHWHQTADGGRYWTLTIEAAEARAIRVHLENLTIPPGGHVMVYNTHNVAEIYGPYRQPHLGGATELWTTSVFGPVVTVEYYAPAAAEPADAFTIGEISHMYADPAALVHPALLPCYNDVTCYNAWGPEAAGVMGLGTIGGGAALWCSASVLNHYDTETWTGYVLTANHCLSGSLSVLGTQADANTIEYYWFYQTPTCNGTVPNLATVPRTATGSDLLSNQTGNDHAFMRIRSVEVPGGVTLLGWDTASFANGDDAMGIHHPDGSHKRLSIGDINSGGSDANYWDVIWNNGSSEPGSSGSPVFDAAHRVRGQACCMNVFACPSPSTTVHLYYGRFNVTYPLVRVWFEIGGTIQVNAAYVGVEEGTPSKPFRTASAANALAWNGARIKFQGGSYPEVITFTKQVTLLGENGVVTIGN